MAFTAAADETAVGYDEDFPRHARPTNFNPQAELLGPRPGGGRSIRRTSGERPDGEAAHSNDNDERLPTNRIGVHLSWRTPVAREAPAAGLRCGESRARKKSRPRHQCRAR